MAGLEFKSFTADWRNGLKSIMLGINIESKTAVPRKEGSGAESALRERACGSHVSYRVAVRRREDQLFLGEKTICWGKDVGGGAGRIFSCNEVPHSGADCKALGPSVEGFRNGRCKYPSV